MFGIAGNIYKFIENLHDHIRYATGVLRRDDLTTREWRIRMEPGDGLLYLNKSRDCLQWHRFTHEPAVEAVLYSFLKSRCHLSELEYRRMRGGLLSRLVAAPRSGRLWSTLELTPLLFYPLRQCSRDCRIPLRVVQSSRVKEWRPRDCFSISTATRQKGAPLFEVALFVSLPGLCLLKYSLVRQVPD